MLSSPQVRGGHYSIGGNEEGTTRTTEAVCPRGFYCTDGIIIPCRKGRSVFKPEIRGVGRQRGGEKEGDCVFLCILYILYYIINCYLMLEANITLYYNYTNVFSPCPILSSYCPRCTHASSMHRIYPFTIISYGSETGLTDVACSGYCPPAHYCPEGTSDPVPCPEYTYSAGGLWTCNTCPGTQNPDAPISCQNSRSCCFRN